MNVETLNKILTFAVQKEASDIHIVAGTPPTIRVHGQLKRFDSNKLTAAQLQQLVRELLSEEQLRHFEQQKELDFAYPIKNVARFRTNVYNQLYGISIAFRVIPEKIRSMQKLEIGRAHV